MYCSKLIGIVFLLMFSFYGCNYNKKTVINEIQGNVHQYPEDIVFGNDSAAHVIYLFASYKCKFCRLLFLKTFPQLKQKYLDQGKLKVVVKLLEFGNDFYAIRSLKAGSCIARYGMYDKFHELLLANHTVVASEDFRVLLDDIMAQNNQIAECFYTQGSDEFIKRNVNNFRNFGLSGTPSLIINRKIFSGFIPFGALERIIKDEFNLN